MKKFLAMILCAIMILSAIPITVGAETLDSGTCGDNLTWTLDSSGTLTISGTGGMKMVSGKMSSAPWEEHSKKIKKAVISYGVTNIGECAFAWCSNLTSVTIPNSVTTIGYDAFAYCIGLTSINIPNGVTSIGSSAFYHCTGLTKINIPNGVTSIGGSAFSGCENLTNITIPNSVTSIGGHAFFDCSNLKTFEIPDSVKYLGGGAFDGTEWYNNQPNGVVYCGNFLSGYKGIMPPGTSIDVKNGTIGICNSALEDTTNLSYVILPDGLEYIDYSAFWGTGIKSIDIPNSVKSIGQNAFLSATNLKNINLSDNLEEIGYNAFYDTGWYNSYQSGDLLYLDKWFIGVKNNSSEEYNEKKISTINIKSGTVGIATRALAPYAFFGSPPESILSTVVLPDSLKYIGNLAFENCVNLKKISLPGNIIKIGEGAFSGCGGLTSIIIPNKVTSIGAGTFSGCSSLTSITIPSGITSIYNSAFSQCGSLNISVDSGNKNYSDINGVLCNKNKTEIIKYAKDKIQPKYTIPSGVTRIGNSAFARCSSLTSVTIPSSVTSVGESAFEYCENLTSVTIPDSVKSISYGAFYYCTRLTSITIPSSVTSIGNYAFCDCESLTSITIPSNITSIGESAFEYCDGLTDVYYGGSEADWQEIIIADGNDYLTGATIHYNSVTDTEPTKFEGVPTVSAGNGVYNVSATLQDIDKSCVMVAALYNGRKLAGVKIINLSKGQTSATASLSAGQADTAKVCIWDSAKNMKPLCEPKTITIK